MPSFATAARTEEKAIEGVVKSFDEVIGVNWRAMTRPGVHVGRLDHSKLRATLPPHG